MHGLPVLVGETLITIELPFPPAELSPNSRCGWRAKAAAVQAYRYECKVETLKQFGEQTGGLRPLHIKPETPVKVTLTFVIKGKRRRDIDNLLASIKSGIDGMVDSHLLYDDDVRSWAPSLRYEQGAKAAVRVELGA